ncbi:MAG: BrnT family toxin [Deltaproteobacteria bacterium]|nr:BrnT family toxin [Deltaproteobacteria bacterium]
MRPPEILQRCTGFDWDEGNRDKNWAKHGVSDSEAEQVFFNRPVVIAADPQHSGAERRFLVLGCTDAGRRLFIAFTVRRDMVRVISARDMTRKEVQGYERHAKRNPGL